MLAEASVGSRISFVPTPTVEMDECSMRYHSVFESSDAKDPEEDDDWKASGVMTETPEVTVVSAGRSNGVRPLARNLVGELDDVTTLGPAVGEDDEDEDKSKVPAMMNEAGARPTGDRPPLNGDTPAASLSGWTSEVPSPCPSTQRVLDKWLARRSYSYGRWGANLRCSRRT
ncbi:hypothetical protein PF010_g29158 [Phytophthora fragariae]|uniref:Uncharacterized protein n=1 Tax=Phytophthora fragariae TaxID=53985 RepID=A0A6G0JPX3_9STRA|nr:hypothetical protein PF010_g29158 [Phytophthora fragariae]